MASHEAFGRILALRKRMHASQFRDAEAHRAAKRQPCDASIRPLAGGIARLNPQVGVQQVLEEVLPARRETWAERLLLTAIWLQAGSGDASPADEGCWQDCAVLAH
jgi:hypothetical protein